MADYTNKYSEVDEREFLTLLPAIILLRAILQKLLSL